MNKFFVLILFVSIANAAFAMNLRNKRQTEDGEDNLEDRYGWFRPPWQYPTQRPQRTTRTPALSSTTTPSPESNLTVQECLRICPVTSEYNPVCGTNNITYPNPGRLLCAQTCGITVSLLRTSPCPSTTAAPV